MSQSPPSPFPPDPPLARLAPDAAVQPAPPSPVPAVQVAYSLPTTPAPRQRPAVLTTLGVTSILAGVVGLAATAGLILFAVTVYAAAKAADVAAARSLPATPPAFLARPNEPPPRVVSGPEGLADEQRAVAVNAIQSRLRLGARRAEQLDAMLARAGRKVFGLKSGDTVTAQGMREAIVDHGDLFAGSRRAAAPPEYFKTAAGRVELTDDRAVFHPDDGSPPVRTSAQSLVPPKPLTPEQVQAVVKQARATREGRQLNAFQVSALSHVLSLPNQRLAQAAAGLGSEPRSVTFHPGGGATLSFTGGELHLTSRGQILNAAPTPDNDKPPAANVTAFVTCVIALAAGGVLAVVLLVSGVLLLRDAPGRPGAGRRWLRAWAVLKIPVAIVAAAGFWWMLDSAIGTASGGSGARLNGLVSGALWLVLAVIAAGAVYATAVLVSLRAKTVREFYSPVD